ncbi:MULTISPECIES: WYL domain-containing protein [Enterobacterales]|uniref:WYL domain-containing protein n=1 Tax=Enterobacterales TaxID=91347 RepID=UPI0007DAC283|nr:MULTISPECIES: WYL domain-containing protein [Enterobacterales]EKT9638833.1 WYL domain-containing protein [Pluralibacter gergoviae]ATY90362.1 WYL domain-containing protein [Pectobacterium atrosepticum]EMD1656768.1 WYL domain-containing protein [Pluralibacter gergoviae]MBL0895329.1 WYL domain-containing protein [Pectobacterium atrosepticum]MCA6979173.1 WYL domain-containing protein [Pectobacterium atrosepticum]
MTDKSFTDILKNDQNLALRLAFIDFLLLYKGQFSRLDITKEFDVSEITATRIIAEYNSLRENNFDYDKSEKKFIIKIDSFIPFVDFSVDDALEMLAEGFNKNKIINSRINTPFERVGFIKSTLNSIEVSKITRAMLNNKKILCNYDSASSKNTDSRLLSPLAILFDGRNWIFRAYHENAPSQPAVRYKNFNFSRVIDVSETNEDIEKEHSLDYDSLWKLNLPVELEINSILNKNEKERVARDFGIPRNENKILLTERAALIWIILNQWMVHYKEKGDNNIFYNFELKNHDMLFRYGAIS